MTVAALERKSAGDTRWTAMLAGALLALLAARVVALAFNGTDLFFDEAQYWSWSEEPAFGYYSKPPLIAWIIRAATLGCGASEFCVRLPSPLLHTATAAVVFLLGRRLYDARIGFWSAIGYATLPGVSVSAGIISTDVPLLFFWALALLSFVTLIETKGWAPVLLLGVALGGGLNAKYAMAYFALCIAVYIAVTPARRVLLRDPRLWAALALGVLLIAPNLIWNASNGFATFAHTADNAKWSGRLLNPGKAAEFFGAQFGVFGPILFGSLLVISWRAWRRGVPEADRLLLAFALPVIAIVTAQAFISRAHANWAAVSYIAATVLVMATLVRELSWRWLTASLAIHLTLVVGIGLATAGAGKFRLPFGGDPFTRTLGWAELAGETRRVLDEARRAGRPFRAVITDDRAVTAELLYYLRGEPTPILAWQEAPTPRDHYELTRPYTKAIADPVLLVTLRSNAEAVLGAFTSRDEISTVMVPAGAGPPRRVAFVALRAYRGR